MDPGAITLPNVPIKYYNPFVTGGSIGHNDLPGVCFVERALNSARRKRPNVDHTIRANLSNRAFRVERGRRSALQTGIRREFDARSRRLPHPSSEEKRDSRYSVWKHIMMQTGSNDLCHLCLQSQISIGPGSPDDFETNIRAVLERMKVHLPNTIVNLSGVFRLSGYTSRRLINLTVTICYLSCSTLCSCALPGGDIGRATRKAMDDLQAVYNDRPLKVVSDYQRARDPTFAVT